MQSAALFQLWEAVNSLRHDWDFANPSQTRAGTADACNGSRCTDRLWEGADIVRALGIRRAEHDSGWHAMSSALIVTIPVSQDNGPNVRKLRVNQTAMIAFVRVGRRVDHDSIILVLITGIALTVLACGLERSSTLVSRPARRGFMMPTPRLNISWSIQPLSHCHSCAHCRNG